MESTGLISSPDIAWAQLQTALDGRVLIVLALAESFRAQYRTQVRQLGDALVQVGATDENPHASHDMPRMATAETMDG